MYALLSAKREDGQGLFKFIKQNAANIHEKKSKKNLLLDQASVLVPKDFLIYRPAVLPSTGIYVYVIKTCFVCGR